MNRRLHAFTLIELLVVISIIGLLVSILLPALRQARVTSQMAASMANLSQLGVAQHLYAADNRQSLIWLSFWDGVTTSSHPRPTWAGVLNRDKYVSSRKVFWGPARDTSAIGMTGNFTATEPWWYTGYGMNVWASPSEKNVAQDPINYKQRPANLDQTKTPAHGKFVLMTETSTNNIGAQINGFPGYYASAASTNESTGTNLYSYSGATPHVYLDGHGSSVAAKLAFVPYNPIYGRWTYTSTGHRRAAPWYWEWWL
jgi:prepilin-type N-terminal cleavage/methylation domain-containing protein